MVLVALWLGPRWPHSARQTLMSDLQIPTADEPPSLVIFSLWQCNNPTPAGFQPEPLNTENCFIAEGVLPLKNGRLCYNHGTYRSEKYVRSHLDTSGDNCAAVFHSSASDLQIQSLFPSPMPVQTTASGVTVPPKQHWGQKSNRTLKRHQPINPEKLVLKLYFSAAISHFHPSNSDFPSLNKRKGN